MERILVVLPNWFGETLFATPFLRALRRLRPQARIATLGWPQCREVLLHNPDADELLVYDEQGVHRGMMGKGRLLAALRQFRFEGAFILRKSLSRSLLLAIAGIPVRIGFNHPKSGWLLTHKVAPSPLTLHKAFTYLALLGSLPPVDYCNPSAEGFDSVQGSVPSESRGTERGGSRVEGSKSGGADLQALPIRLRYVVSEEERRAVGALLDGLHSGRSPLVILHPGANWAHKRWPADRFAVLGDRLAGSQRVRIVITGAPGEISLAEGIARHMRQPALVLAGRTTIRQLGACLEQAQLVIAGDTGVLHIAAALDRPIVALYGPTSPALTGPLSSPAKRVVLHHPDCCPQVPCYRPEHPSHPGMEAITVDEAYAATCSLLTREAAQP